MSKKNIFKKNMKSEKLVKEYNMKADFLHLGFIFATFIIFLIGLYYYDQQNNILKNTTEQLMNLF